jgi:hypothetical protein
MVHLRELKQNNYKVHVLIVKLARLKLQWVWRLVKLSGNGSNKFFFFKISLGSWLGSFEEFEFAVSLWANLSLNFHHFIALKNKPILHGFQVQNVIFPICLTMHALVFCTKSYGCFNFYVFVCVFYKWKICAFYYLSSFLKKVIYLVLNYVIMIFLRLWELFQVYNDVSNQVIEIFKTI